ncbi:MAG: HEAT repeat domain-containing protein [Polyangiaceae bacterium]|nr:HEAT repeat domain-containing protein [Polyangiaceae bacterium]MCW5792281.1 HEAT repeat domain-containing protein [Polyangiaceae bacterium]
MSWLALAVGLSLTVDASAQFNPSGRKPQKPPSGGTAKPRPKPKPTPDKPNTEQLIQRYLDIVLKQPGAQFPLQRLAQLYRERDGDLEQLIKELEKLAQGSGERGFNARVALAGAYRQDGRFDRAIETYEAAIQARPKSHVARLALAHLLQDRGDKAGAYERFKEVLPQLKDDADIEQTLRTLMSLALDLERYADAEARHAELVKRGKGSFFVRAELGRELMLRGKYERAVKEFEQVVKHAAGDNRVLAPALRDLGQAQVKAKQTKQALDTLTRALRAAGEQAGVRREIYDIIVSAYRAEDKLRDLIALVEKEPARDFYRARMLGALYEETGQVGLALKAYREALTKRNGDIETRLKLVQLLQIQGELEEVIKQYEELVRAAPRNPDFVFQLAEALIQRGDRKGALTRLTQLEARSRGDEETLAALVDFYERVNEEKRARAVLESLANRPQDPRHLIDLGDRYFQDGDRERAVRTWKRLLTLIPNKAKALFTLGEVYLEHDMAADALAALREATQLAPKTLAYKKGYALALERTATGTPAQRRPQYDAAIQIWEELLSGQPAPHLAREARQHIVTLWALSDQLSSKAAPLARRLAAKPPDLEAGRLLAEVHLRGKRHSEAEQVLKRVVKAAPGDAESYLRLEHALVVQRKLPEAISVLERLVKVEPKRAREYYQRMAGYAAEQYKDDDAIRFAEKALELSPDDAEGHRRLGEMYRRRQDNDQAIGQFRLALSKNDRLFPVYFQLAELLVNRGEIDEADRLLRRVVRAAPDEDLVAQATRLSVQLNLGRDNLESLEQELLPVTLGNPGKPVYRRLLIELYSTMAFPLVHQSKSKDAAEAKRAAEALARIGERAVKPLLDTLADEQSHQQRVALELLSHIRHRGAGPTLIAFASGTGDSELRSWAMAAVASLRDPSLLPKLSQVVAPGGQVRSDEADPVLVNATAAVAQLADPKARPLLVSLLGSEAPSVRALAALGLGRVGTPTDDVKLAEVARSVEAGPLPRAAAAFALGERRSSAQVSALLELVSATDPLVRGQAMLALARLKHARAPESIARAWLHPGAEERRLARAAALAFSGQAPSLERALSQSPEAGRLDVRQVLMSLGEETPAPSAAASAIALLEPALAREVPSAVQSSPERAAIIAALLPSDASRGALGFQLDFTKLPAEEQRALNAAVGRIAEAAVPAFVSLASHPSRPARQAAVSYLASRRDDRALAALVERLSDTDSVVQLAALSGLGQVLTRAGAGSKEATRAAHQVAALIAKEPSWPLRARAAEVLGELGQRVQDAEVRSALTRGAKTDSVALVREGCLTALLRIDPSAGKRLAAELAKSDPEPRVRAAAERAK